MLKYKVTASGCWEWLGWRTNKGYGMVSIKRKTVMAHRYFYEKYVGPIPTGLEIDHLCRNHSCVNPAHLEAVTHFENMQRYKVFLVPQELCKNGHPLTGVHTGKKSGRYCKVCVRDSKRRQRAARRG